MGKFNDIVNASILSNDIQILEDELALLLKVERSTIFPLGKRLVHIKENKLQHGKWMEWLEVNGIEHTKAKKWMKIYRELHDIEDIVNANCSFEVLYHIATLPKELQNTLYNSKYPWEMTTKEIKAYKKELKGETTNKETEQEDTTNKQEDIVSDEMIAEWEKKEKEYIAKVEKYEEKIRNLEKTLEDRNGEINSQQGHIAKLTKQLRGRGYNQNVINILKNVSEKDIENFVRGRNPFAFYAS